MTTAGSSVDLSEATGRTYHGARPYEVGREKIVEFAEAIGDPNLAYRDAEGAAAYGHPDVIAPPTFAIVVAFEPLQTMLADLGLRLQDILHADQKFIVHRPIRPGDLLTATLTVDSVRRVAGTDLITTRTEVSAVDGEPVTTAVAKIVHRPAALEEGV